MTATSLNTRLRRLIAGSRWPNRSPCNRRAGKSYARRIVPRLDQLDDRTVPAAAVWTDMPDYLLRDTPYITAAGLQLGETVQFQVLHTDAIPNTGAGHASWSVTDGGAGDLDGVANGNIQTTWSIPQDDSAGSAFAVTVTRQTPLAPLTANFTVSNFFGSIYNTIVPSPGGNPSGSDCVTQLQSDLDGTPPYGYLTFIPTGTLTFSQIYDLHAVYSFPVGTYGGGSPRFEIPIDTDGDGVVNGSAFVYLGTPPNYVDPGHTGFVNTGNEILDLTTAHWDLTAFGGPFYGTYAQALALLGTGRVLDVELVVDGGWRGDQVALVDSFTVNDKTYLTLCNADLAVTKTDNQDTAIPGLPVTYDITVTNNGPSPVANLTLKDIIPPEIDPATVIFSTATGVYNPATGAWTGVNLAQGESVVLHLTGTVLALTTVPTMTNTAAVFVPADMRDTNPANNVATDTDTLTPVADLWVRKVSSLPVAVPNRALTYIIRVGNNGPSAVTGFTLVDLFPPGFTPITYTPSAGTFDPVSGVWTVTLAPGQSVVLRVRGRVGAYVATGPSMFNHVTVTPPEGVTDSNANNNEAHHHLPVVIPSKRFFLASSYR